jgi:hypothetical protein
MFLRIHRLHLQGDGTLESSQLVARICLKTNVEESFLQRLLHSRVYLLPLNHLEDGGDMFSETPLPTRPRGVIRHCYRREDLPEESVLRRYIHMKATEPVSC